MLEEQHNYPLIQSWCVETSQRKVYCRGNNINNTSVEEAMVIFITRRIVVNQENTQYSNHRTSQLKMRLLEASMATSTAHAYGAKSSNDLESRARQRDDCDSRATSENLNLIRGGIANGLCNSNGTKMKG